MERHYGVGFYIQVPISPKINMNQPVAAVATCTNFPFQIWMTGWTNSLDTNKHLVSLHVSLQHETLIIFLI